MKIHPWTATLLLAVLPLPVSAADEARFMTSPDISGERILFTYDDDLWLGTVSSPTPIRLTTHPGRESSGKFSPDGKWIAFTGSYDGPAEVYLLPVTGGQPKRLTYQPGGASVVGWTPDSRHVVFRSTYGKVPIARDPRLYRVNLAGNLPEALPVDRGVNASFSEDGQRMLYVQRGNESYSWKRYKGGQHPEIWLADLRTPAYTRITDYVGRNAFPMWIGQRCYFTSDRGANGITNLWSLDLPTKATAPVTQFSDFDVMSPSTDRQRIIFVQNGYLQLLDVRTGAVRKLPQQIATDRWRLQPRWVNPTDYVQQMDISNDGKQVILTARGDVFQLRPREKGTTWKNLSATSRHREAAAAISPDGKTVAFFSDRSGEYQLYRQPVGGGPAEALTDSLKSTVYHVEWSPDGKKLLFGNKDFALFVLEVATRELTKIDESHHLDNDEFTWEMSDYAWSPDSRWVAYSFCTENRNNVIFLYDTQERRRTQLTNDFFDNLNPRWDADGGVLYFLSNRNYEIAMDLFEDNHIVANPTRLMVVQLRQGERPPFHPPGDDDEAKPAEPETTAAKSGEEAKPKAAKNQDAAEKFRVDVEGIQDRIFQAPVAPGNYFHLLAGHGTAAWSSVATFTEDEYEEFYQPGGRTKWQFHLFTRKDEKTVQLEEKIAEARASANGEHLIFRREGKFFTTSFQRARETKKVGTAVDTSGLAYRVVPADEWAQIFDDTWRWYRDFFYDKDLHGRDWAALGAKYRACLPDLRSREQLNWLLSELVGELCVSHTYVSGGDSGPQLPGGSPVSTGLLGADLVADPAAGLYRFQRLYGPTRYFTGLKTPLQRPDLLIKEGHYLLAINGQKVRPPENYFRLLQVAKDDQVEVTVTSEPTDGTGRTYRVRPLRGERDARYARWVTDNIETVLARSGGRVGYMHINAMGGDGVMEFDKFWRAFRYKEGLIIDVRGNSGGWTEYFLIDKLERQQVAFNVLQGMAPYRYPNPASRAHFVVLSNEDNGSDGEAFVEHFKARKLGTVVGVPSWGGLVGIVNGQPTIDNGRVHQPNNAFYGREGRWLVENHGADPDIIQLNDPASVLAGRDPQLEKAVDTALQKIKERPFSFPPVPPYPKK